MIAVSASFLLPEYHVSQKVLHRIVVGGDKPKIDVFRIFFKGVEAPFILGIGVNIGVVKKSEYLIPPLSENLQGVNGAGGAAYMEENFHENFI